jgi:UDP-glucose 4-epimerase
MKDRVILIVGGAGFIGSHVNKMLNKAGYKTVVLDNLSKGRREAVAYGTFIEGDLGNTQTLEALFKKHSVDAVMHFAAFIDVGESVANPLKYYENNVVNTLRLLEAMIKYNVKKFIFSSSAAIFGLPQILPLPEDHPSHPINPYGETKWMVEKILHDFDVAYGLKSCCLRYFNAAGGDPEGEILNYQTGGTNLIPIVLRSLKSDAGSVTIFGTDYPTEDGTCVRDYIHIDDLGEAHIKGLTWLLSNGDSCRFNLGNGRGYSVNEVIQAAEKVTGKTVNVKKGSRRPGDPPLLVADSTLAFKLLNWKPKYPSLESIIGDAWTALRSP